MQSHAGCKLFNRLVIILRANKHRFCTESLYKCSAKQHRADNTVHFRFFEGTEHKARHNIYNEYYDSLYKDEENSGISEESPTKGRPSGKGKKPGSKSKSSSDSSANISNSLEVNTYKDENIAVTVTKYREYETDIYVADVKLASMKYFKTAFADDTYGRNITAKTSEIAESKNAVLAINGDYYGARNAGYVIRNGVLYRDTAAEDREALVVGTDGSFEIITEKETSAASQQEQLMSSLSDLPLFKTAKFR